MVLCCWLLARSRGFWLIHQNQFPESPVGFHSRSEPCSELNGGFWGGWLLARLMFPPSTARSMTVGQFLVLAGACQFGHSLGGFTINFIHSFASTAHVPLWDWPLLHTNQTTNKRSPTKNNDNTGNTNKILPSSAYGPANPAQTRTRRRARSSTRRRRTTPGSSSLLCAIRSPYSIGTKYPNPPPTITELCGAA